MTSHSLTFDAVAEAAPGPKWQARWQRSWPAYRAWFQPKLGAGSPSRRESEAALAQYMPELLPVYRKLLELAGGGDLEARFLSTWCPPRYLGGCSLAALAEGDAIRLVRNYDLSPDLNEGLLLRSAWTGQPVMGMVEFLWGLSDGVNADGLAVAIAYGGRTEVARGFGVTTIIRYVLETCSTVREALAALGRVPSHMAYNIALADRGGATAVVELVPGGGVRLVRQAIATNHRQGDTDSGNETFTKSRERLQHLRDLLKDGIRPAALGDAFLEAPLYQRGYARGFGTLFTAVYDPSSGGLTLRWPGEDWVQSLDRFAEGRREIRYDPAAASVHEKVEDGMQAMIAAMARFLPPEIVSDLEGWRTRASDDEIDWADFGKVFADVYAAEGRNIRTLQRTCGCAFKGKM